MYKCKYSRLCVKMAIRKMAKKLRKENLMDDDTVFLVMLSGGVWFSSKLFDALGDIHNEVFYIKGHSYEGKSRGKFEWDLLPKEEELSNRNVILIDDICDSGMTLQAACDALKGKVKHMMAVTLVKRMPCPIEIGVPVWGCIEDESKDFFVGCGLDDSGKGRLIRHVAVC